MSAPFTPEQETRLREIAREEILKVDGITAERDWIGVSHHSFSPSEIAEDRAAVAELRKKFGHLPEWREPYPDA